MDTVLSTYAFNYGEVYARSMFTSMYKRMPSIITINDLDYDKAYEYIAGLLKDKIKQELNSLSIRGNHSLGHL